MDNTGLILPLNIISRNLGDSIRERNIRANFNKIITARLQKLTSIPVSDQLKIRTLVRQIEQVEPEWAAKIRKLFEEPCIF